MSVYVHPNGFKGKKKCFKYFK